MSPTHAWFGRGAMKSCCSRFSATGKGGAGRGLPGRHFAAAAWPNADAERCGSWHVSSLDIPQQREALVELQIVGGRLALLALEAARHPILSETIFNAPTSTLARKKTAQSSSPAGFRPSLRNASRRLVQALLKRDHGQILAAPTNPCGQAFRERRIRAVFPLMRTSRSLCSRVLEVFEKSLRQAEPINSRMAISCGMTLVEPAR